jgi:hypothetical protein
MMRSAMLFTFSTITPAKPAAQRAKSGRIGEFLESAPREFWRLMLEPARHVPLESLPWNVDEVRSEIEDIVSDILVR